MRPKLALHHLAYQILTCRVHAGVTLPPGAKISLLKAEPRDVAEACKIVAGEDGEEGTEESESEDDDSDE